MFTHRALVLLTLLALSPFLSLGRAAPPDRCKVSCRVESTEYATMGGTLDRSIVWVLSLPGKDRVTDASSVQHQFAFDLAPGEYTLQCTGVGSRGATFQPTYKPFTVRPGTATLDLGAVDMPVSEITRLFGKKAPELTGVVAWKNTAPVTLKEQRGKVVVLDFWNYSCSICIAHMPDLAKLADKYPADRLAVLTVHDGSATSMADVDDHLRETSRKRLGNLPVALDKWGPQSVFRTYGIRAVPAVILIDPEGKVVRRFHHAGDPELDRAIGELVRKPAVAAPQREAKPAAAEPTLALKIAHPPVGSRRARLLVFEGDGAAKIHRPGPEHFKLTRMSDGTPIPLAVAYERESLDDREPGPRQTVRRLPPLQEVYPYNHLFNGVRLFLDTGPYDAKDAANTAGFLNLFGRAQLEAGVRYRLTWACWPVGAPEAKEVSHDFVLTR